jgi:hypothetical protein
MVDVLNIKRVYFILHIHMDYTDYITFKHMPVNLKQHICFMGIMYITYKRLYYVIIYINFVKTYKLMHINYLQ